MVKDVRDWVTHSRCKATDSFYDQSEDSTALIFMQEKVTGSKSYATLKKKKKSPYVGLAQIQV